MKKILMLFIIALVFSCDINTSLNMNSDDHKEEGLIKVTESDGNFELFDSEENLIVDIELYNFVSSTWDDLDVNNDDVVYLDLSKDSTDLSSRHICSYGLVGRSKTGSHTVQKTSSGDYYECAIYFYAYKCTECSRGRSYIKHSLYH